MNAKHIHGLGIGDLEEVNRLSLEFDHLAFLQFATGDSDRVSLIQPQGLHHPMRQVDATLLGDELEYSTVCGSCGVGRITKLEHPRRFEIHVR